MSKRIPTAGVEKAPARSPQAGNNLWITAQPPRIHGSRSVRRACPHPPGEWPTMEGTLGSTDRAPLRGGSQEAALPEGLAQVGSPGAGLAQACSPGGLVNSARFVHSTGRLLQPFLSRVHDKGCPGHAGRGKNLGASNRRRGCSSRRKPYRAPEPRKLGWSGPERGLPPRKAGHEGNLEERRRGVREIPVVLVDRTDCRRRRTTLSPPCESR